MSNSNNSVNSGQIKSFFSDVRIYYVVPFAIAVVVLICVLLFAGIKTFDTKDWSIGLFVLMFLTVILAILAVIILVAGMRELSRTHHLKMGDDIKRNISTLQKKMEELDDVKSKQELLEKVIEGLQKKMEELDDVKSKQELLEKVIINLQEKTKNIDAKSLDTLFGEIDDKKNELLSKISSADGEIDDKKNELLSKISSADGEIDDKKNELLVKISSANEEIEAKMIDITQKNWQGFTSRIKWLFFGKHGNEKTPDEESDSQSITKTEEGQEHN